MVKNLPANAGDMRHGFDPVSLRSPGEGKGYPLQYSGLENSMNYIVHGVTKSRTRLSDFHFHFAIFQLTIDLRGGFIAEHKYLPHLEGSHLVV